MQRPCQGPCLFSDQKDKNMIASLEKLRFLGGGSAKSAEAALIRPSGISGPYVEVSTILNIGLQAELPSVTDLVIDSVPESCSHVSTPSTATPVIENIGEAPSNVDDNSSTCASLAGGATDSISKLCLLVLSSVPSSHPVLFAAKVSKTVSKIKALSINKLPSIRKKAL